MFVYTVKIYFCFFLKKTIILDLGLIVWSLDYSLWSLIGQEFYFVNLRLTELYESIKLPDSKFVRLHVNDGNRNSLISFQTDCYIRLYCRLMRINDLLQLVCVCFKVGYIYIYIYQKFVLFNFIVYLIFNKQKQ